MWPPIRFTVIGQKNEIGELVKTASVTTCDRISRKQILKLNLGNSDRNLKTLDARTPAINANTRLWVGPRWKTFPFPSQTIPRRTSISGRLEIMRIPSRAFHRLRPDLSALHKVWMVQPIAEWAIGNGIMNRRSSPKIQGNGSFVIIYGSLLE